MCIRDSLCAGPHLMSTGCVKAVKLLNCTGAYWRADANNKMLQRVYGISFPKASQLDEYVTMLEEAKKRDHRKIGKDLELFTIMEEGPGFPFFLPKGMVLKNLLIDYWREIHREAGYQEISTPVSYTHLDVYKRQRLCRQLPHRYQAHLPVLCHRFLRSPLSLLKNRGTGGLSLIHI